jgi:hypothetical protein
MLLCSGETTHSICSSGLILPTPTLPHPHCVTTHHRRIFINCYKDI